jgi:hypothetical protein
MSKADSRCHNSPAWVRRHCRDELVPPDFVGHFVPQ